VKGMKIKREYHFENESKKDVIRREIEVEENERIGIRARDRVKDEEVISFFAPGVLTLTWESGAKLDE